MPDDSPGLFSNLTSFANAYLETKTRRLQNAKPQTKVDSGGSQNRVSFAGQDISRSDLKDIKEIRESGGIITSAYDAKALMRFGTGVEFHAEDPDLEDWLRSNLPNIDLTVLEMGEDATYYPYYVGESVKNRVGGFSHIEHIEPWTMLPITDEYGDIVGWEQELSGTRETEQFTSEEIGHIVLNKSSGRDKTGISDVLQNKEEIETFRANQQAMRRATERLGYPFVHAKAGREGAAQLNDNELRRIRNRLADIGPGETQVTGPDVDIELKEGGTVDFGAIQERDTRMLSTAIGIPLELLNEGSDGLGSGKPAEARLDMFALQNEAARRRFAAQFKSEFLVDIVREYSPFDHTQEFGIHIKPFLDDKSDMAELIQKVGDYMTANEVRSKLDMEPLEDDEKGEAFQTPADEEAPEDEGGGLFGSAPSDTDFRGLAEGYPIDDRSECDGQVVEGPRGGLRCIPGGDSGGSSGSSNVQDVLDSDATDDEKRNELESIVSDNSTVEEVSFDGMDVENAARTTEAFTTLSEAGETEGIQAITTDVSDEMSERRAMANYDPFSQEIRLDPDGFTQEKAQEWGEQGFLAGNSIQHLVAHEVGHHNHFTNEVDGQSAGMNAQTQEIPQAAQQEFAEQVSVYAVENPNEMVAELYALKVQGEELTTGMENAYEEFNGPEVNV
ncbi:hypothetical protein [Halorubrum tailed virus BLv36]|nr:hypothetical protein [Halorubrum tailed virus BLv36]